MFRKLREPWRGTEEDRSTSAFVLLGAEAVAVTVLVLGLYFPRRPAGTSWNAVLSTSGAVATARNESYHGALAAVAGTTFGFLGTWTGTNTPPVVTCAAT